MSEIFLRFEMKEVEARIKGSFVLSPLETGIAGRLIRLKLMG